MPRLAALIAVAVAAMSCGDPPGAGTPDAAADVSRDIAPIDVIERADGADSGDAVELGTDVAVDGDLGFGCDDDEDCAAGLCVDLLPGPGNGFCTTRCEDDAGCPEGFDCILIHDDEHAYSACIDADFCFDGDEDGYGVGPGCRGDDCNDAAPAVNAGATEVCNGDDDDCDGAVDDNPIESGDDCETGFPGGCSAGRIACVSGLNECVPRTPPGDELCDGVDNDCDGEVDEEALDSRTFFRDADADRFGAPEGATEACSRPAGHVDVAGDCDDAARGINPTATEICDGVDNDCDGVTDGEGAVGGIVLFPDRDDDGYGDPDSPTDTCGPTAGFVGNDFDCDDAAAEVFRGADERCNGIDDDCDDLVDEVGAIDPPTWYRDEDEDGFGDSESGIVGCDSPEEGWVTVGGDCDDGDDAIHPEADETCDGIDNDCNDEVDDGLGDVASLWYADRDSDGWGDDDDSVLACAMPDGRVARGGDCDDGAGGVNPEGVEVCNGVDDDCDERVDEGLTSTWYRDFDDDGYGDRHSPIEACTLPDGYVDDDRDCNDETAAARPGLDEVCDDLDNDCNGVTDDGVGTTWYQDTDGDGWGETPVVACTRPPRTSPRAGDCNDANPDVNPDAPETCTTPFDDDCDGESNEPDAPDASWWFLDSDGDGQGMVTPIRIPPIALRGCDRPDDFCPFDLCFLERIPYVDNEDDCDDSSSRARVGGAEVCDGYDNDCNGTRDDGFEPRDDFYRDRDGDGVGDRHIVACMRPIDDDPDDWVTDCCDRDDDDPRVQ